MKYSEQAHALLSEARDYIMSIVSKRETEYQLAPPEEVDEDDFAYQGADDLPCIVQGGKDCRVYAIGTEGQLYTIVTWPDAHEGDRLEYDLSDVSYTEEMCELADWIQRTENEI